VTRRDPHSCTDSTHAAIEQAKLAFRIDFEQRKLHGRVQLHLNRPSAGEVLHLDTRELHIHAIDDLHGTRLPWKLYAPEPILGRKLEIELPKACRGVEISYSTTQDASALQWLEPQLTTDKTHPFLFSQCQPHHARSLLPIQDSPSVRFRFTAQVDAPEALTVVMAAAPGTTCESSIPGYRCHRFEMPQAIPAYLMALAVGRLDDREIGRRSKVYAEPSLLEAAAFEFAQVEQMIDAAEDIFGPYLWDRFDFVVMPSSFPYGGMENPRMTFLTPTLLAGDRSNVNVLAHELAHSWTGNLVTNATMNDFWLNEGFTVWAERRIVERLKGSAASELAACVGRRGLDKALQGFAERPQLTRLRTDLRGIDPDEVFSVIPYEKGYLFLRVLEQHLGRTAFDKLVAAYIAAFCFRSIDTDDFIDFVEREFPGALAAVNATEWIDGPGLPSNAPVVHSPALDAARRAAAAWPSEAPPLEEARGWSPELKLLFLDALPRPMKAQDCARLEALLELGQSKHCDVVCEWLTIAAASAYEPAMQRIESYLGRVGRLKLLRPIYTALCQGESTRDLASRWFELFAPGYHPIARSVLGRIVACAYRTV
jgi:aminopeptidase N